MAIDQEIQRKVDAYRGNPQALQQRYAQNQQLVDLLALQKLKSEMDAAKRDVQMKMQQQPSTIKQQREQELMQRTKQEMMDQTAGVMRQKQAQQQQNLQKVAQGGLGALAPQRPQAPNPAQQVANQSQPVPRMAAGGIVAFQEGGLSSMAGLGSDMSLEEQIAIIRRRTDLNEGQKASLINQLRNMQPEQRPQREYTTPVGRASSARMPGVQGSIPVGSETSALDVLSETRPQIAPPRINMQGETPDLSGLGMGPEQRLGPRGTRAAPPQGIESLVPTAGPDDGLRGGPAEPTATEADVGPVGAIGAGATGAGAGATGAGGIASIGGGSAEAAMERGFARSDQYTGRQEKADRYSELEAQLAALDAEYDPAQARRDELVSFLIGTGGRGSTALAGGAAAALQAEARNRKERRDNLVDRIGLAERGMTMDTNLATLGMQLGREMYAQVSANNRQAASDAAAMSREMLRDTRERAKMEADERRENRDEAYRRDSLEISRAQAVADDRNATITAASSALARMETLRENEIARQEAKLGVADLRTRLDNAMIGEDTSQLQADLANASALAVVTANEILAADGFFDAQEGLILRLQNEGLADTPAPAAPTEDDLESIAFNPIGTTQ